MRNHLEYINTVVLLAGGILAQLSTADDAKSGLVVILIPLAIFAVVNLHDLAAHMAGVDFRWSVMWSDTRLVLVEFAAPLFHSLGFLLTFLTVPLLLPQGWKLVWFGIWGSLLFLAGGLVNLVKVFKMQQRSGVRLERLGGGAQERLRRAREGQEPLLGEEPRAVRIVNEGNDTSSTTYKDVLISES